MSGKEKIIYINFNDEINKKSVKALISLCLSKISEYNPDTLYFLFATSGGEVDAGIVLYNFFKSLYQKIVMHNIGSVDSIGTIVFLAGKERYASPHTTFLFHNVENTPEEGIKLNLKKLEELISKMKQDQEKIASIVSENSSISKEEMYNLFDRGESKSAEFTKEKNFVHDIKSLNLGGKDLLFNF